MKKRPHRSAAFKYREETPKKGIYDAGPVGLRSQFPYPIVSKLRQMFYIRVKTVINSVR
jgi:hypothetical protein